MKLANVLLVFFALCILNQLPFFSIFTVVEGVCACVKPKKTLSEQFFEKSSDCMVIIKFYAPWCPSCQEMNQVFQEISEELGSKKLGLQQCQFFSVDIDQNEDVVEAFGIKSIPAIYFLKNKKIKEKLSGIYSAEALKEKILAYQK